MKPLNRLLLAAVAVLACHGGVAVAEEIRVQTRQGPVIGETVDGVRVFRGVPYAQPPVGPLRWKPPLPPSRRVADLDATKFGPPCPSFNIADMAKAKITSGLGYDILANVSAAPGSHEACLNLNIWAPTKARRAAVMVWFPPSGGGALPVWDGWAFARDGVILVTIDFRQFTLGNFSHPALAREAGPREPLARFQTMDQLAALRWVKQNIAAFGGDPGNVTMFGVSNSAASVLQILTLPSARGLFDKAIAQSANGWWSPLDQPQMEQMGVWLATQAGLPGKDTTAEQLRALPVDKLPWFAAYSIDGRLARENATTAIGAGRVADVPLMIGWNDFDGSSLRFDRQAVIDRTRPAVRAAYAGEGKSGDDLAYQLHTDSHVAAPARWVASKTEKGAPTYLYQFSYVRSVNRGKVRGAAHGDEISFVFDTWGKSYPTLQLSDEDRAATRLMHSCWVSFAKSGKPRCEGAPAWPRYTARDDRLMDLGASPMVRAAYRKAQLDAQEAAMQDVINETKSSLSELLGGLSQ